MQLDTMGSDHIPVVVTINIRPDQQVNSVPRWKLAKADWDIFRTVIETYTKKIPIDVSDDIDITKAWVMLSFN